MGKWLDTIENENSARAISATSAIRSELRTGIPQNKPIGTNGTNGTEPKHEIPPLVNLTPLAKVAAKSGLAPANLNRQDWIDFYQERVAIIEHDGGLEREKAERLAYESCVAGLENAMANDYRQDHCAACASPLGLQQGLPLADGAVVCDGNCHTLHRQQQRERAERQLASWGMAAK